MLVISRLLLNSKASIKAMSATLSTSETCSASTPFSIAYVTISNQEQAIQLAE
jgi:hypothetical protein